MIEFRKFELIREFEIILNCVELNRIDQDIH